jgi:hypothetical protein
VGWFPQWGHPPAETRSHLLLGWVWPSVDGQTGLADRHRRSGEPVPDPLIRGGGVGASAAAR